MLSLSIRLLRVLCVFLCCACDVEHDGITAQSGGRAGGIAHGCGCTDAAQAVECPSFIRASMFAERKGAALVLRIHDAVLMYAGSARP